jgi:hypothetical protein
MGIPVNAQVALLGGVLALLFVSLTWLRQELDKPATANFLIALLLAGILTAAALSLALQVLGLWLHELGVVR